MFVVWFHILFFVTSKILNSKYSQNSAYEKEFFVVVRLILRYYNCISFIHTYIHTYIDMAMECYHFGCYSVGVYNITSKMPFIPPQIYTHTQNRHVKNLVTIIHNNHIKRFTHTYTHLQYLGWAPYWNCLILMPLQGLYVFFIYP